MNQKILVIKPDGSITTMKGTIQDRKAYITSKFQEEVPESLYEIKVGDVLKHEDVLTCNNTEYKVTNVYLRKSVTSNYTYHIKW